MLGNIFLFVLVIIFLVGLIYLPYFIGMMDEVKNNWSEYRCSPTILPIAGYINKEDNLTESEATQQNFEYCTGTITGSFMGEILEPINYISNGLTNLSGDIVGNLQFITNSINILKDSILKIVLQVVGMFVNSIIEIIKLILNLNAIFGKLESNIMLLAYSLKSTTLTMGSAWNGPTGDFIRKIAKMA